MPDRNITLTFIIAYLAIFAAFCFFSRQIDFEPGKCPQEITK